MFSKTVPICLCNRYVVTKVTSCRYSIPHSPRKCFLHASTSCSPCFVGDGVGRGARKISGWIQGQSDTGQCTRSPYAISPTAFLLFLHLSFAGFVPSVAKTSKNNPINCTFGKRDNFQITFRVIFGIYCLFVLNKFRIKSI